jgi:hypothetical protein
MSELENKNSSIATNNGNSDLPRYEPPRLTLMDEDAVLSAFQVPVVAASWWVM